MNSYKKALICASVMVCMYGCLKYMSSESMSPAAQAKAMMESSIATAVDTTNPIIIVTTKADLDARVAQGRPTMLKGKASWCGPCQDMGPVYHNLASELGDQIDFLELDVDNFDDSRAVGVNYLPTFIGWNNGQEVFNTYGEKDPQELKNLALRLIQ